MYKILIVDDVPINIKLAKMILDREKCYQVETALNGGDALKCVKTFEPDLILLDEMMPDINGIEVASIIRQAHTNLDMPIIMITAAASQEMKIQALKAGIDEFLGKPIDQVELITRIRILLKSKSLHNELQRRHDEIVHQMELAKHIQQKLQSTGTYEFENLRIEASYYPMFQIGGDIVFIKQLSSDKTIIFIGDVSGHGISAALVSTLVKALLEGIPDIENASTGINYINTRLSEYFNDRLDDIYVTGIFCVMNHQTQILSIANAGHPMPLVKRSSQIVYEPLSLKSEPPIGVFAQIQYSNNTFDFNHFDEVIFYTDGLFPMLEKKISQIFDSAITSEMLEAVIQKRNQSEAVEQEDDFAIVKLLFKGTIEQAI